MARANQKEVLISKSASKAKSAELDLTKAQNEVLLRGRISSLAIEKVLPSGDKVMEFRIVVARSGVTGFDTLDICAWSAKLRRSAGSLKSDQWVEIAGSIRHRFLRGNTGIASRWQIDALEIIRL
jgi:single-strand DNA-binding protein